MVELMRGTTTTAETWGGLMDMVGLDVVRDIEMVCYREPASRRA